MVRASRSTYVTISADGKLMTHSAVRIRFSDVCDICPKPSMQVHPNHQVEDIGARLGLLSGLSVLISATGVPKYEIFGSTVRCINTL